MVNNQNPRILVPGACKTKAGAHGRTKITNGPVYDLEIVKRWAATHGIWVINDSAEDDMAKSFDPEMQEDELAKLVHCLTTNHFIGSERCATTPGTTVDADEYEICWSRAREREATNPIFGRWLYIKLGFSLSGNKCLVLSIHPSNRH